MCEAGRLGRVVLVMAGTLALGAGSAWADIVPESRESTATLTVANLGPFPGYLGGYSGDVFTETGLASGDDLFVASSLFYGPDGFNRVNAGDFSAMQTVACGDEEVDIDFSQSASGSGNANPFINMINRCTYYFSVDADTSATVRVTFDGDIASGDDFVGAELLRVEGGDDPATLETLFALQNSGAVSGSGEVEATVELLAGERYEIFMRGDAEQGPSSGLISSAVRLTLTLACPADLASPTGVLDFFDVLEYLARFDAEDPSADLAAPDGTFDFFDVLEYLSLFDAECE